MKKIISLLLILCSSHAFSQQYYPLVCKGSPDLKFGAYSMIKYSQFNSGISSPKWYQVIYIKSGSEGADPSGLSLSAGECAFFDRKLRNKEPRKLLIDVILLELEFDGDGNLSSKTHISESMKQAGHVRTFMVRNAGGFFRVKP